MPLTDKDRREFLDALWFVPENLLDEMVAWVGTHQLPEDVFPVKALTTWAAENGFRKFD